MAGSLAVYVYEFVYVGRKLLAIQDIKQGAQRIASGDLEYKINTDKMAVYLNLSRKILIISATD